MSRRVGLPGAAELFRPTTPEAEAEAEAEEVQNRVQEAADTTVASGRVRHDEKITIYVSSAELLALEHARLRLRAEHGLAVDRGRIARTAIGLIMADFDTGGADSSLVRALTEQ